MSFIERYLVPLVYPDALTRELQLFLGGAVVAVNAGVYFLVPRRGENLGHTEWLCCNFGRRRLVT